MTTEATPATTKPQITFEDFAKVDLRVAKITHAEPHPNADRLIKLQLDDGSGTPRQICAGVKAYYEPEQLIGRHIVIVANLAPRTIRGEESNGMLLAASDAPKDDPNAERHVVLLTPMAEIAPGSTVS
ncbi:MAG: methionine--tRNA ligase subunit beta [Phycisphaeraceae bacterium]|nr:methionine--tRNA ligase subunit beta [Phycisphaeraceae bacterium]MCB9847397.1 methionine--tRNA ligase subunit beta [Phycisphaeraceae bacterium]